MNRVRERLNSEIALISHLRVIQTLTTLNLARCLFGDEGAQHLANALRENMVRSPLHCFSIDFLFSSHTGSHTIGSSKEQYRI